MVRRAAAPDRAATIASLLLALTLAGDVLLYVILPARASEFGLSLVLVGVLLSANRLVRLVGHGAVMLAARRVGMRKIAIAATSAAAHTTSSYAWASSFAVLLGARILWGLAFAALSMTTAVFVMSRGASAARSFGAARSIEQFGAGMSLVIGAWLATVMGARTVFFVFAALALVAIPLAASLPHARPGVGGPSTTRRDWLPTAVDGFSFAIGLVVDGALVMLLAIEASHRGNHGPTVLLEVALVLALRRFAEAALAPVAGLVAARWGAARVLGAGGLLVVLGLLVSASGPRFLGASLVALARASVAVAAPAHVVRARSPGDLLALVRLRTFTDAGAALGPLLVGCWPVVAQRPGSALVVGAAFVGATMVALILPRPARRPHSNMPDLERENSGF